MSLDVWFREDIQNTLLALNQASMDTVARIAAFSANPREAQTYRAGYGDALRAVAIAFGIPWSEEPLSSAARTVTISEIPPEPLIENLRLPRNWTEVEHDDELSGA